MWLALDVCGINVKLRINAYKPTNKDNWDSEWCR